MSLVKLVSDDEYPLIHPGLTTFLNPHSYLLARDNVELFSQFDRIHCDGILLVNCMRLVGKRVSRISFDMTSMAPIVFSKALKNGLSICLVGGEPGVAKIAGDIFSKEYAGLKISHSYSGYFESDFQRSSVINEIASDRPDIVIVGMGAILQERFLVDLHNAGWRGYGYTCGGFFHQTASGGIQYYPNYINRLNLRWLYRIFDEPALFKRYIYNYPRFIVKFFNDLRSR